ncbi:MerR family transcriptional regulator [Actinomadura macra]|uniref:MerR family transcriptional regulator n=1 Tax=Actinomadura macra TaxID=46164 RepID=UPI000830ED84|nr:MerR family transcriptional regulator [Actinomadura macra]
MHTTPDGSLGIGDLAALTGVPVRTIRFYCDEGILEPARSAGGHRRFGAAAVDRLRLVRRLRGLGLGLPAIASVLRGERSVGEAAAAQRAALDVELATLAWRRAALRAIEDASPAERAARLELLAAVEDGPAAREVLSAFWRRLVLAPVSPEIEFSFVDMSVPPPPADPTPDQVLAYAEMVVLVGDESLSRRLVARGKLNVRQVRDERTLLTGIGAAIGLALPRVAAGEEPGPGPALDLYVEAHASVRDARDTPDFRRALLAGAEVDGDPRMRRYWELFGAVTGEPVTGGGAHIWLVDSLARTVG